MSAARSFTLRVGFSELSAPCGIIEISWPRTSLRFCSTLMPMMLRPAIRTSPEVCWSGGMSRPIRPLTSVVLPQPDSPAMPRISPGWSSKETSSTAWIFSPKRVR